MWDRLCYVPRRWPFQFAVLFGGAKTIGADVYVQKVVENADEIDTRRAMVFLGFGLIQVGAVQYALYVSTFTRLFSGAAAFAGKPIAAKLKDGPGLQNLMKQVCLDQFVYHPLMYFPVFYSCQEILKGESANPVEIVKRALTKYIPNMKEDLLALWKIFIPSSIIQFSFVPLYLRVPFCASVGIFWCGILSAMRGDMKE